eukprot:508294-Rhodomonas_salina.4
MEWPSAVHGVVGARRGVGEWYLSEPLEQRLDTGYGVAPTDYAVARYARSMQHTIGSCGIARYARLSIPNGKDSVRHSTTH